MDAQDAQDNDELAGVCNFMSFFNLGDLTALWL
jgi:hypothetical protein